MTISNAKVAFQAVNKLYSLCTQTEQTCRYHQPKTSSMPHNKKNINFSFRHLSIPNRKLQMLLDHKGSEMAFLEQDSFLFQRLFLPLSYLRLQLCKQRIGNMWYGFQKRNTLSWLTLNRKILSWERNTECCYSDTPCPERASSELGQLTKNTKVISRQLQNKKLDFVEMILLIAVPKYLRGTELEG